MKKIGYANALHIIECMDSEFSNSSSPLSSKPPPPPPLHMRANTKQHARDEDFSSNTVDRTFLELLKMEAVIALCLVGENAIKKFRSFLCK